MKKYRYYFFFFRKKYVIKYNENSTLYAYTDTKEIYELFIKSRNMDIFRVEKKDLTREEVNLLTRERYSSSLVNYKFTLDKNEAIYIPITYTERTVCSSISANIEIKAIVKSYVLPAIFERKYIDLLYRVGYTNCYIYNDCPNDLLKLPKASMIKIFIKHYSHLLDFRGLLL